MSRFRTVVAAPGAPRLLAASFAARLPIAMTYTAIVLLVLATTHDATVAGLCAAAFGLVEGVGSPLQGRLVDRFGQPRVLVPAATLFAGALAGVVASAEAGLPSWTLVACSAVCGAGFPIVSSAMRALWPAVVDDETQLPTAYALESVLQTLGWVAGPLIVALLVASLSPGAASAPRAERCACGVGRQARDAGVEVKASVPPSASNAVPITAAAGDSDATSSATISGPATQPSVWSTDSSA